MISILAAVEDFLRLMADARSQHTARTYANGLQIFSAVLETHEIDLEGPVSDLDLEGLRWFLSIMKDYAPATEQVYVVAVNRFYHYLVAEELAEINLERMKLLINTRTRRPGIRLPQFPKDSIEKVISYAQKELPLVPADDAKESLRNLRDAAFILTLADTGLRVHEACGMVRGDLDWQEQKAIVIGKGDKQNVVRFSSRGIKAIREYLNQRATLDGALGKPLHTMPLFARHDKGAGSKVKAISTATGRNIIKERVRESLGEEVEGVITPHSFRHYFVTNVLQGSGGNLKLAQELARHTNIQVTQRYAHLSDDELDQGYHEIFEGRS